MDCPRCGAAQDANARFCNSCGAPMAAPAAPPPAPPGGAPAPPPAMPAASPAPAPRGGVPGWLIGCIVALVVVLIVAVAVTGVLVYRNYSAGHQPEATVQDADKTASAGETKTDEPSDTAGEKEPDSPGLTPNDIPSADTGGSPTEPEERADPKEEARAVLDAYISAERARNSPQMATYLTGEAAAKFDATQTAHDTEIKSVDIASAKVVDSATVVFQVVMGAADLESGESYKMHITYRVIQTDDGWKISSIKYQE